MAGLRLAFYMDMQICFAILYERKGGMKMRVFTAVIEKCSDTKLYVGFVPGFPGAHSQGETLDELNKNLKEVIEMLLEDGEPSLDGEFVGTQNVVVA
jgi:predicted RNase H-like HicB family nuclease